MRGHRGGHSSSADETLALLALFKTTGAPGTPAYNPAWYALTDVYLDPVAGNDAAAGTSPATAVKTMAEIVRRYGSSEPQLVYAQPLTIHQLTAQIPGVDAFYFSPKLSGGSNFVWLAAAVGSTVGAPIDAPFAAGSVTPKVTTALGNDLEVAGFPGTAAPGQIVHNVDNDSYAFIDSIAAGVATLTQPFTAASALSVVVLPVPVEDNAWDPGDSLQLLQPLLINWKNPFPGGGDVDASGTAGAAWVQGAWFPDASGTPGHSNMTSRPGGISETFSLCRMDPFLSFDGTDSARTMLLSCWLNGGVELFGFSAAQGGASNTAGNASTSALNSALGSDIIIHGPIFINGAASLTGVHVEDSMAVANGGASAANIVTGAVWGASTVNVANGSRLANDTAGLWVNCLRVATLLLDGLVTGSSYNPAAVGNPFTAGVALTSANLDTFDGLQNPSTGSRYAGAV